MKTLFGRFAFISGFVALAFVTGCDPETRSWTTLVAASPRISPSSPRDVFQKMDGAIALSEDEIKGRNTWNLWTAGNEQFWDRMSRESFGLIDLLSTIDSRNRASRFKEKGLINQPGYRQAPSRRVWPLDRRSDRT